MSTTSWPVAAALALAVAAFLCASGLGAYVYVVDDEFGGGFWQQAAAAYIAASLAITLGIPAGLWVNEQMHREQERQRAQRDDELRELTLRSLASELEDGQRWLETETEEEINLNSPSLSSWLAASAIGSLGLLDFGTLNALTRAYHGLNEMAEMTRRFNDARLGPGAATRVGGKTVDDLCANELILARAWVIPLVGEALVFVRRCLEGLMDDSQP